ncbi:hypothetical protein DHEL01_v207233 [Diaporthe helianthi]|uniref:Linalool dehydratase/isomerase domain-containing protein n=1 Tax=Diaporthe helianthi TaxID=158607 RepID=A0A2P5HVU7_DIAHE|nr:hypothetical protein DHEL01_v207233 [Diaporthe helianthi]
MAVINSTSTSTAVEPNLTLDTTSSFPPKLAPHILQHFPNKLDRAQAGHIRHFHNLATQLDGEWRHMGGPISGQELFDAYRYQIATMTYAAGVAHYHRLPALRSVFRTLFDQLIHKMMLRDVWGYWFLTSQSGKFVDPDITELRKPWPDPVRRENIMFSGHLLLMTSLYAMLFDDDKYDEEGALTFDWDPVFFGLGPEKFPHSRNTLQQTIISQLEKSGWMGVCCEPNCIFVICNQFPMIAMRYNDVRKGTDVVSGVLEKYQAAWKAKNGGFISADAAGDESLIFFLRIKQDSIVNDGGIAGNAWACAFMNAWNSEHVHEWYPKLVKGHLTWHPDGRVNLNNILVTSEIRAALKKDEDSKGLDERSLTVSAETFAQAASKVQKGLDGDQLQTPMGQSNDSTTFGFTVQWVSEVAPPPAEAERDVVSGLLKHADAYLNPTWENGGLFYPRRDGRLQDEEGNWTAMDVYTGNAAIGYGRLNVRDGQKKMWEDPWTKDGHHATYPYVEGVDLSSRVDFLRGEWNEEVGAFVLTMRTWDGSNSRLDLKIHNLPTGLYGLYQAGQLAQVKPVKVGGVFDVTADVGADEVNVVLVWEQL